MEYSIEYSPSRRRRRRPSPQLAASRPRPITIRTSTSSRTSDRRALKVLSHVRQPLIRGSGRPQQAHGQADSAQLPCRSAVPSLLSFGFSSRKRHTDPAVIELDDSGDDEPASGSSRKVEVVELRDSDNRKRVGSGPFASALVGKGAPAAHQEEAKD
jgi:hypothetical protein